MEESGLLKLSLSCSLLGLLSIFLVSGYVSETTLEIGSVTGDMTGVAAKVCGNVTYRHVSKSNHLFFRLTDSTGMISVVVFNSTARGMAGNPYSLKVGDSICAFGKVGFYKGSVEILADRLGYD